MFTAKIFDWDFKNNPARYATTFLFDPINQETLDRGRITGRHLKRLSCKIRQPAGMDWSLFTVAPLTTAPDELITVTFHSR